MRLGVVAFLSRGLATALVLFSSVFSLGLLAPTAAEAVSVPRILNYQAHITDSVGVVVPDGPLPVVLKIWDAATGGTCLYVTRGTCGTPATLSATTTDGVFSMNIGDETMNQLPISLFDGTNLYLGVTIGSDSEMTPRKRFTSVPYAVDSNLLDGLDTSALGGTGSYIPSTSSSGLLTITGDPTASNAALTVNPAAAQVTTGDLLLALQNDGANRLTVDVDGNAVANGSLSVRDLNAIPAGDIFSVTNSTGSASYLAVSATSTYLAGNVGIGTATPNNKFQVAGLINFDDADSNVYLGTSAGAASTGSNNIGIGSYALNQNTDGSENTAIGARSLYSNTLGSANFALGTQALFNNLTGDWNTAIGVDALLNNTVGSENTAIGFKTLYHSTGDANVAIGYGTLYNNTSGAYNSALGSYQSLYNNTTGSYNVANGYASLAANTTGSNNTAVGYNAGNGSGLQTLSYGTFLGYGATASTDGITNSTAIGNGATVTASNQVVIGNSSVTQTILKGTVDMVGGLQVGDSNQFVVDSTGNLAKLNGVGLSWPMSQGAVNSVLKNDGSGNLYWSTTAPGSADVAEWYPVEPGIAAADIVVASATETLTYQESIYDPKTQLDTGVKASTTIPVLTKATQAYGGALGVVSTNPAETYGQAVNDFSSSTAPIAITGRVLVKVTSANGAIKPGDAIAASNLPGVGMLATKPGMIIGYALGTWAEPGVGTVMVNVNASWSAGGTINSNGVFTFLDDSMVLNSVGTADATTASDSYGLSFRGSAWDATTGAAVNREISMSNKVADADDYRLAFADNTGLEIASLSQNGDLALSGRLTAAGSEGYAEMFRAVTGLEAGDLVMADDSATSTVGIRRASGTYENALIGVITDQAGVTVGQGDQPVALTGRIPAKVTNKNGAIKVGDPITSSDIPGVGMRATEPGRVVGIALQSYDNANVGLITVFVNPSWYSGPAPTSGPAANSLTITDNSLLDFKSSALTGIGSILAANGSWSVTADGHLTAATVEAQTVTAEAFVVRQTDQSQTTGEGTIAGGSNAMVVHNAAALSNSRVFVTFEGNPGGGWWVAEQGTGDFTIHLVSPAGSDLPFRYWIMNVDDQRTTATTMTDSGTSTTPTAPATSPTDSGTSTDLTGSATGTP